MKFAISPLELLLVAGISAVMVIIAVPGYMDAQTRTRVMDTKVAQRYITNGLLLYKLDTNEFPEPPSLQSPQPLRRLLSTEIAKQIPADRFKDGLTGEGGFYADPWITYDRVESKRIARHKAFSHRITSLGVPTNKSSSSSMYWFLKSIGPDRTDYRDEAEGRHSSRPNPLGIVDYDPSNGIMSQGEIIRSQIDAF